MITYIILAITAVVSWVAFSNHKLTAQLQFNAALVIHQKQYYRLLTHTLVHASWSHLFVNMLVLFFFGRAVESYFHFFFGKMAVPFFLLLYLGGAVFSNALALYRHKNNFYYNAVGASGAVSSVLFTFIFFNPWEKIYFFGILPIPGIIFAVIYLVYSWHMSKKEVDQVAHDAHLLGALFGFLFPVVLRPALFERFLDQLLRLL